MNKPLVFMALAKVGFAIGVIVIALLCIRG